MTAPARRDLRRLDPPVRARIQGALDRLTADPPAGDLKRLAGRAYEYRLRVGDWRVLVFLDRSERAVVVVHVLPRGRAYRD